MKIASHLEARAHSCVRDKRALQAQAWHHWRVAPIGAWHPLARGTHWREASIGAWHLCLQRRRLWLQRRRLWLYEKNGKVME